jgi:L-threonylcarbamoyladenylate synthase
VTLELLRLFGGAIVAPSANLYGRVSPTTAQDVEEELAERVDCIVDGGRCDIGIESTIVDLSSGSAKVVRLGKITQDEIDKLLGESQKESQESVQAYPGNKPSHYAPEAKVILSTLEDLDEVLEMYKKHSSRVGVLTSTLPKNADERVTWLLLGEDLKQQAHELYAQLRKADKLSLEVLIALLPKDEGIGSAIRDRLKRAAGLGGV